MVPVEFTQQLSTDLSFEVIIAKNTYKATSGTSHIQRWTLFLDPSSAAKNVNVYSRLIGSDGAVISKVWTVKNASKMPTNGNS
jgi:hypothetical protein